MNDNNSKENNLGRSHNEGGGFSHAQDQYHAVSLSGGKDSTCLLLLMIERGMPIDAVISATISQGGTNVSGGQKQRLSIARALVKNADIYIFDDTFSALDYHTDALLREALNKMVKEKHSTVFIVAQRISSIMHADKIIVLDQGKIVGNGTHAELMKNCPVYQEIAYSQLSRKELAVNE